jgi:hypothetical protein
LGKGGNIGARKGFVNTSKQLNNFWEMLEKFKKSLFIKNIGRAWAGEF